MEDKTNDLGRKMKCISRCNLVKIAFKNILRSLYILKSLTWREALVISKNFQSVVADCGKNGTTSNYTNAAPGN